MNYIHILIASQLFSLGALQLKKKKKINRVSFHLVVSYHWGCRFTTMSGWNFPGDVLAI